MLVDISFERAVERLGANTVVLGETIVPQSIESLSHSPYRPEYGWLFTVERRIGRILDRCLAPYRRELIGPGGLFSEGLSNAYCHGHRRDASIGIDVQIIEGANGVLVRVRDSGPGFDYRTAVGNARSRKRYYQHAGRGLRGAMNTEHFAVFYNDGGRGMNVLHLYVDSLEVFPLLEG